MPNPSTPQLTVISFLTDMRAWESAASKLMKRVVAGELSEADGQAERCSRLQAVFKRHVADQVPFERVVSHPYGKPPAPMNDPDLDRITDTVVVGDSATVTTVRERGPVPLVLEYHLRLIEGRWMILDDRVRVRPNGDRARFDL